MTGGSQLLFKSHPVANDGGVANLVVPATGLGIARNAVDGSLQLLAAGRRADEADFQRRGQTLVPGGLVADAKE